jgi:uncharacterized protein
MTELEQFRMEKNKYFANDPHSPLARAQRKEFSGLKYFPENPKLSLEVQVEQFTQQVEVEMQTSSGDVQVYTRYGRFKFEVEGVAAELTLYHTEGGFFLPFADALAGKETYGAGRYLEPEDLGEGRCLVDFNYAYNPYCAYNDIWSCPITPAENRLKVAMRAGEMSFHD